MSVLALARIVAWLVLLALLGLLAATAWQNRDLPRRLRDIGRAPAAVLGAALRLWSPLAFAIAVLVVLAQLLSAAAVAVAERSTPLEAWCVFVELPQANPFPCTGVSGRIARSDVQKAGSDARSERLVVDRYLQALAAPGRVGSSTPMAWRDLAPAAILGLPTSPEDDPELQRMLGDLRTLIATPAAPARSVLDQLRFRADSEIRERRMRELTAQVIARREGLAQQAYAGLAPTEQARRWWQHHLAHRLAQGAMPATEWQAIAAQASPPGRDALQAALPAKLAEDAAWAVEAMQAEARGAKTRAGLGLALPLPDLCVFASNPGLAFDCPRWPETGELQLQALHWTDAVPLSIDRWYAQRQRDGLIGFGRSGRAVRQGALDAHTAVRLWQESLPAKLTSGRAECSWRRPADCADHAAHRIAEQALAGTLQQATRPASAATAEGRRLASAFEWEVAQAVPVFIAQLERSRMAAQADAAALLRIHAVWVAAGWCLLAFLSTRSFLYVLGLVAFRHGGPAVLGFADAPEVTGRVRMGRRLALAGDSGQPLVTRRQLSNSDNQLRLAPWPGSAPIGRLLRGRYLWYTRGRFLADGSGEGEARIASAEAGKAIVEWRMQAGEEVVFAWRDFFGASEGLRFRTRLSLRLSTLLLGRVLFRIASCPANGPEGSLLLKADVEEGDPARLHAVPPERLLAWNRQVRFRAHGADTAWGVLVHGYTLVRDPGSSGLVLATSVEGGPRFGSLRFLRRMFTAIF